MSRSQVLSPLADFVAMISMYFAQIWDFLIYIGRTVGTIILVVAILWFIEANMKQGKGLVFGGILLSIVVQYFVMCPPAFVVT